MVKTADLLAIPKGHETMDVIIGPSVTPTSLAALEVAGNAKVPMVSLAGGGAIVLPQDGGVRHWAFKLSPTEQLQSNLVLDHFLKNGGKTIATISFASSLRVSGMSRPTMPTSSSASR